VKRGASTCEPSHTGMGASGYRLVAPRFRRGRRRLQGQWKRRRPQLYCSSQALVPTRAADAGCTRPTAPARGRPGEIAMGTYRVLSDPESVIYVFSAHDDEEAERFARQLSRHSRPARSRSRTTCVRLEGLVDDDWRAGVRLGALSASGTPRDALSGPTRSWCRGGRQVQLPSCRGTAGALRCPAKAPAGRRRLGGWTARGLARAVRCSAGRHLCRPCLRPTRGGSVG
jgi:hypothetical protein